MPNQKCGHSRKIDRANLIIFTKKKKRWLIACYNCNNYHIETNHFDTTKVITNKGIHYINQDFHIMF